MATPQLPDDRRTQLDGIVQQMHSNGESDENIQAVVDDFKQKYATSQTGEFFSHLGEGLNPINWVKGARDLTYNATMHPIDTFNALFNSAPMQAKIKESWDKGNYLEAARHIVGLLPVIGPQIDEMGNKAGRGEVGAALGDATSFGLTLALGDSPYVSDAVKAVKSIPITPALKNANPVRGAAAEWALEQGIPVPSGAATGNPFISTMQRASEHTPLGAIVAGGAKQELAEAMSAKGGQLAERVSPKAMVPETAGEAAGAGVERTISKLKKQADTAYDEFRAAEQDPKNIVDVPVGTKTVDTGLKDPQGNAITRSEPITDKIAMPVDMRPIKAALRDQYESMKNWLQPAKRNASAGFQAMDSIVNGPDFLPATQAEQGLGGLKSLAREAESPDLRDVSQGIGANAGAMLQDAIDSAVARTAGGRALQQLRNGRAAHAAKMEAADVLGKLRDEPVQLFNQLTYANDAGVNQLRNVAELAPKEMAQVGRAYVEKLLDTATAEGGFQRGAGIFRQWENLGAETKKILFKDPAVRESLDKFFQVAKMVGEQPNPSMTAVAGHGLAAAGLLVTNPLLGASYAIGSGALVKALYSPKVSRALTQGLRLYLDPTVPRALKGIAVGQILNAVGRENATDLSQQNVLQPAAAVP